MKLISHGDFFEVLEAPKLSLQRTFDCGQCFRFEKEKDNSYFGIAYGKPLHIWQEGDRLFIDGKAEDFESLWHNFLDLDRDYNAISERLPKDDFTQKAIAYGSGMRVLAQEPWEALCSFIISQCNNIPRIQSIIHTLCTLFGDEIWCKGNKLYAFPTAKRLSELEVADLAPLRAGYRAPYIIAAARDVFGGRVDFEALRRMKTTDARKAVMAMEGVGPKVADCFLLFGLQKLDAFPVDTWMKKAACYYEGSFDGARFGEYAGIAQQYIFYYARSLGNPKKMSKTIDMRVLK